MFLIWFVWFFLELPWDQPSLGCAEYVKWKSNDAWPVITPWTKLDTLALSLLRKILEPISSKRIVLSKIIDHKWCHTKYRPNGKFCHFLFSLVM